MPPIQCGPQCFYAQPFTHTLMEQLLGVVWSSASTCSQCQGSNNQPHNWWTMCSTSWEKILFISSVEIPKRIFMEVHWNWKLYLISYSIENEVSLVSHKHSKVKALLRALLSWDFSQANRLDHSIHCCSFCINASILTNRDPYLVFSF